MEDHITPAADAPPPPDPALRRLEPLVGTWTAQSHTGADPSAAGQLRRTCAMLWPVSSEQLAIAAQRRNRVTVRKDTATARFVDGG